MKNNKLRCFIVAAFMLTPLSLCISFMPAALAQTSAQTPKKKSDKLSLEQIMAHPDWMGIAPERPYFSIDGRSVYFQRKKVDSELRDLIKVSVKGGEANPPHPLTAAEVAVAEAEQKWTSTDRSQTVWLRNGNLFLHQNGKQQQLTRTGEMMGILGFVAKDVVATRRE
ncbi:MAG: hypothetical protein K2P84_05780, partial [Undibacterium sp.]|nr:hypothetical protein [Undibacterium sp.]